MLKPHSFPTPGTGEETRHHGARRDWRLLSRLAFLLAAGAALARWSSIDPAYGVGFWVWAGSVVGYTVSFAAAERRWPRPRVPVCAALLGILALAAWLRFSALNDIPANISIDEVLPSMEAETIASGGAPNVFSSAGWFSLPNLTFTIPALVIKAVGHDPFFAVRLSSAFTGLAGILCTFLLARRLFGDRAGLLAAFLMAVSYWHIHNSRTAFPFVQSSFCTAAVIYPLVRAGQDGSRRGFAVAGVALGLALQCYFPVRILLLLCPLFFLADAIRERMSATVIVRDAAIVAGGAALALGPLLVSVPWNVLAGHSQSVLITAPGIHAQLSAAYHVSTLWGVFWHNLQEAAAMFTDWADVCVLNRSPAGLLDSATLGALILGVVLALLQDEIMPLMLVAWAALTFVFGVAFSDAPRASYRLAAAMPALMILAAYGIERVLALGTPREGWYRILTRVLVLVVLGTWALARNYHLFFVDYANGDGKETAEASARRLLAAHCDGRGFYFVGDWAGAKPGGASEPGVLDLFCPQHQAVATEQLPRVASPSRPATFLVLPVDMWTAEALRRCYPSAQITSHRSRDGRLLFTTVDVAVSELAASRCSATPDNALGPPGRRALSR